MRIGFVGVGNMGGAILDGFMLGCDIKAEDVLISGSNPNRLKYFVQKYGVGSARTNLDCVLASDIVFVGVKPEVHAIIAHEFKEQLGDKVLVSMAARVTIAQLEKIYGPVPIVRIMPNLNVSIQEGMTAIMRNSFVSDELYQQVMHLCGMLGEVVEIDEALMSAFIGLAGSSPAFVFRFIDQLIKPALAEGIDPELALHIACVAVQGSAKYLDSCDLDAQTLIANVSSPNGTTIEGLKVFDALGFDDVVQNAVIAVIDKDKK